MGFGRHTTSVFEISNTDVNGEILFCANFNGFKHRCTLVLRRSVEICRGAVFEVGVCGCRVEGGWMPPPPFFGAAGAERGERGGGWMSTLPLPSPARAHNATQSQEYRPTRPRREGTRHTVRHGHPKEGRQHADRARRGVLPVLVQVAIRVTRGGGNRTAM